MNVIPHSCYSLQGTRTDKVHINLGTTFNTFMRTLQAKAMPTCVYSKDKAFESDLSPVYFRAGWAWCYVSPAAPWESDVT